MTSVLIRRESRGRVESGSQGRWPPVEMKRRSPDQGEPEAFRSQKKQRRTPVEPLEGAWPFWPSDVRFLASTM